MGISLASFKNSRIYGRQATTAATTSENTVVANTALAPTLISAYDANRTYITLRNLNGSPDFPAATDAMRYIYQAVDDPVPTIAQILANGFVLDPKLAIDLESPEAVWGCSETANPVPYNLDEGIG